MPNSMSTLMERLRAGDPWEQRKALIALAGLARDAAPAIDILIGLADRSPDKVVSSMAVQVLGKMGEVAKPAVPYLLERLERYAGHKHGHTVAKALGQIGDARPELIERMRLIKNDSPNHFVRAQINKSRWRLIDLLLHGDG